MPGEGFIRGIFGLPGSGKSLRLAQAICESYDEGLRICVTNCPVNIDAFRKRCPDLEIRVLPNDQMADYWHSQPRGIIVAMDEVHLVYDALAWKKVGEDHPDVKSYWSQVRKMKDHVYVVSQSFKDVIFFIRRRLESAEICYKFPIFGGIFLRRKWVVRDGEIFCAATFFRVIPFRILKGFADLYDTHGVVGEVAGRDVAERVQPKKSPFRFVVYMIVGLVAGWMIYKVWPKKTLFDLGAGKPAQAAVAVPVATSRPSSLPRRGFERPVAVVPPSPVQIKGGEYVAVEKGGVVLGVQHDAVVVGDSRGRVQSVPRDKAAEYEIIIAQRDARRSVQSRPVGRAGQPPRRDDGDNGQSGIGRLLGG